MNVWRLTILEPGLIRRIQPQTLKSLLHTREVSWNSRRLINILVGLYEKFIGETWKRDYVKVLYKPSQKECFPSFRILRLCKLLRSAEAQDPRKWLFLFLFTRCYSELLCPVWGAKQFFENTLLLSIVCKYMHETNHTRLRQHLEGKTWGWWAKPKQPS